LALPVNDTLEGYDYPARVRWSLARDDFPCGYTMDADGDTLNIYYGAADCVDRTSPGKRALAAGLAGRQRRL
jgi:hypothetical protein